jgi:DNA modification methylase
MAQYQLHHAEPLPDILASAKTPLAEETVSDHPTMKPQHLLRILVRSLLPLGTGTVLDPFCGSGSTLAACQAVGYDAIGVEIDEAYFSALEENIRVLAALYPGYRGTLLEPPGGIALARKECVQQEGLLF